jgi:hypothetical protein
MPPRPGVAIPGGSAPDPGISGFGWSVAGRWVEAYGTGCLGRCDGALSMGRIPMVRRAPLPCQETVDHEIASFVRKGRVFAQYALLSEP